MVRDNKGTASMGLAGKLYLKRSNYGAFYKDSLSMSQLKLPNIPMPGYAGVCAGVDRREIGCARTFGRFMPIHQIPKTADMMFEEDDSFLSRGFGPNGKHRNGHETYSVTEGALEADNLKIPPLDESELARRERRLNRIAGTSKRAPYLQRASNDDAVTHIDADYRASPDYKSFHQFPPTSDKVSYAPDLSMDPAARLRRPKGSTERGFAPPRGVVPVQISTKFSCFNLPTTDFVTARKAFAPHHVSQF